jgi:hypothetical protein
MSGREGYQRVFYPDANDEAGAKVIDIVPGSVMADVSIVLSRPVNTYSVRAKLIDDQGKPLPDINCSLDVYQKELRIGRAGPRARSNKDGLLTLENVAPGEFVITVPNAVTGSRGETGLDPNVFGETRRFEVVDHDVDLEIQMLRAARASGFVVIEGAAPAEVLARVSQLDLIGSTPKVQLVRGAIAPDGSFAIVGIKPGKLQFHFVLPPDLPPLPLRFVGIGHGEVELARELEVHSGDEISGLRLVLAYANSSIRGIVKVDGAPLPPGMTGVASLIKDGKVFDVHGELSARGEFLLEHLPAGEYTLVVATQDENHKGWRTEQPITLSDDSVAEATVVFKTPPARPGQ